MVSEQELPSTEPRAQFASLVRHLFAIYAMPAFMDSAWHADPDEGGLTQQQWFKWIGAGANIRTAPDLPLPLTKYMAHHFLQAPADLAIQAAFQYARVRGLGGDAQLARSLLTTHLGTPSGDDRFWETVIRWLIAHPHVPPMLHAPIVDYVHHQKFVPAMPSGLGRGQPRLAPCQPNLTMKGRTAATLLRAVEQWQQQRQARRGPVGSWPPSGIMPWRLAAPGGGGRVHAVTELISTAELEEEGLVMAHCAATYRAFCMAGQSSLWSLSVEDADGNVERLFGK